MIYIDNNSVKMTILCSKTSRNINKIKLINQTDKNILEIDIDPSEIIYKNNYMDISTINILESLSASGHYDYYLYDNNEIVESGILQFNNFNTDIKSYNIENNNIIQYEG